MNRSENILKGLKIF